LRFFQTGLNPPHTKTGPTLGRQIQVVRLAWSDF
jgi:hypothetical protein